LATKKAGLEPAFFSPVFRRIYRRPPRLFTVTVRAAVFWQTPKIMHDPALSGATWAANLFFVYRLALCAHLAPKFLADVLDTLETTLAKAKR